MDNLRLSRIFFCLPVLYMSLNRKIGANKQFSSSTGYVIIHSDTQKPKCLSHILGHHLRKVFYFTQTLSFFKHVKSICFYGDHFFKKIYERSFNKTYLCNITKFPLFYESLDNIYKKNITYFNSILIHISSIISGYK